MKPVKYYCDACDRRCNLFLIALRADNTDAPTRCPMARYVPNWQPVIR